MELWFFCQSPLPNSINISTSFLNIKVGMKRLHPFMPSYCHEADISMAQNCLNEIAETMIRVTTFRKALGHHSFIRIGIKLPSYGVLECNYVNFILYLHTTIWSYQTMKLVKHLQQYTIAFFTSVQMSGLLARRNTGILFYGDGCHFVHPYGLPYFIDIWIILGVDIEVITVRVRQIRS